jgi:hypothetical protein
MFGFDSESMEWHFDAAVLGRPCPNASSLTSDICRDFCEGLSEGEHGESRLLQRTVWRAPKGVSPQTLLLPST